MLRKKYIPALKQLKSKKVEREILTKTNKKSNPCISQLKIPSERTAGLFGTCQTPTQTTKIQLTPS